MKIDSTSGLRKFEDCKRNLNFHQIRNQMEFKRKHLAEHWNKYRSLRYSSYWNKLNNKPSSVKESEELFCCCGISHCVYLKFVPFICYSAIIYVILLQTTLTD